MRFRDAEPELPARDDAGQDRDLIIERLAWTPAERLRHLLEMLAFEERAGRARVVGPLGPKAGTGSDK
jgi:hypothetical protein